MSSAPSPTDARISPELGAFFQTEIRNEAEGGVSPATLGSAHESLCQAPMPVISDWMFPDETPFFSTEVTHSLIEFGGLLATFGEDALLAEFETEET